MAVRNLACTHITGNLIVKCPDAQAFEERCRLHIHSVYRALRCRMPTELEVATFLPNCTEMPPAAFGVENAALSLQIPLDASTNCSLLPLDPVLHLNTLKKVQVVTGSIAISNCLKLTTLGGGLSRLRFIGSTLVQDEDAIASHLHISNTGLRGSLARMLPTVQDFSLVGEIVNNAALCAVSTAFSWPPSWLISGNANTAQCGCTFPVALNYNQNALYDDDSCQMTGCNLCHTGTHGPCSFTDTDGDVICSPSLDARTSANPTFFRCHAGTTACTQDLCKDVICDSAPQCQTVIDSGDGAGMCIEGVCLLYASIHFLLASKKYMIKKRK